LDVLSFFEIDKSKLANNAVMLIDDDDDDDDDDGRSAFGKL